MDCLEFRRRIGAEPQSRDAGLLAHRDRCAACAAAWERAQRFERGLHDALNVVVPEGLADRVLLAQATGERRRQRRGRRFAWAIAASLVLAVGAVGIAWQQRDAHSLPALAVAHMPGEIASMDMTRPVAAQTVLADFAGRRTTLKGPLPEGTTFSHECQVGAWPAVHLVSRRAGEPVAVLYLPGKRIGTRRDFRRDGWSGREVPMQDGTLVLLTDRGGAPPFDAIEADWRIAIDGLGDPRLGAL